MAKGKSSGGESKKISFGKKKLGKAKKSFNKHDRTSSRKRYRGKTFVNSDRYATITYIYHLYLSVILLKSKYTTIF